MQAALTDFCRYSDKELIELIFISQDKLDGFFIKEILVRRATIVPYLDAVLKDEKNYAYEDPRFWGVIHAVHIAGIIADASLVIALLSAGRYADRYDIEWILDILPECYCRMGTKAIPALNKHVQENSHLCSNAIASEVLGLWNIWDTHQNARQSIEAVLLAVLNEPKTSPEIRTNLIADFAKIGRTDLRPIFDDLYERGETDLNLFTKNDIENFYKKGKNPTVRHCILEDFYSSEEIFRRQAIWLAETERQAKEAAEDYIKQHRKSIAHDGLCPCGSGRLFRQCHLAWAEKAQSGAYEQSNVYQEGLQAMSIVAERLYENEMRRFLAKKCKTELFAEIQQRIQDLMNAPIEDFLSGSFVTYFDQIFARIGFEGSHDYKIFMKSFMEYFNALSRQRFNPITPIVLLVINACFLLG